MDPTPIIDLATLPAYKQQQIDLVLDQTYSDDAPRWPGMTYEDGVRAAIEWLTGQRPEAPFDEAD